MNSPTPVPQQSVLSKLAPSASTGGTGIGGSIAVIVLSILHQHYHITVDLETAAAITAVCCTLAGYLPSSGRQQAPPT